MNDQAPAEARVLLRVETTVDDVTQGITWALDRSDEYHLNVTELGVRRYEVISVEDGDATPEVSETKFEVWVEGEPRR